MHKFESALITKIVQYSIINSQEHLTDALAEVAISTWAKGTQAFLL